MISMLLSTRSIANARSCSFIPPSPHFLSTRRYTLPPISPNSVVFSGIQPTGVPHIGNYLGALRQWTKLQDHAPSSTNLIFSIVDLHALTVRQEPGRLAQWKRETLATLLAVGLNPKKCTMFFQSETPAHCQLMWILSCGASMGYLSRMTQWKSKLSLSTDAVFSDSDVKSALKLGLFSYPVLQAADILVHGTTHVPVGEDQTQHLEFARECAQNFNRSYGPILECPQLLLSPARRIMSLRNPYMKMSKSHHDERSRILLTDTHDDIRAKIKAAVTDSESGFSYNPAQRPGVSNLLEILCHIEDHGSAEAVAQRFSGLSMRAFKEHVADSLIAVLGPIKDRYDAFLHNRNKNTPSIEEIAQEGKSKANSSATRVLTRIHDAIGL